MSQFLAAFRKNASLSTILNRLLVAALMVAMVSSITVIAQKIVPSYSAGYLPWLALVVSIESMYSRYLVRKMRGLDMSPLTFHLIEAVVLLVLLKLFQYIWTDITQLVRDIPHWAENFVVYFLTPEYIFAIIVLVVVWAFSLWYVHDLEELEDDQVLIEAGTMEGFHSNRALIRTSMAQRIFMVGLLLTIVTAGMGTDIRELLRGAQPVHRTGAINIIVYFALGLLLLSQVQFSILRANWAWERIQIDARMAQRWIIAGLISLAIIAAVAFILPTHYSVGLLGTAGYVIDMIFWVLVSIVGLLFAPILYLLHLLMGLFATTPGTTAPLVLPTPPPPPPDIVESTPPSWAKLLQSIFFWSIFLAIIFFAFYQYFKQNKELIGKLKRFKGFVLISKAWQWLVERFQGFNRNLTSAVKSGLKRLRETLRGRAGAEAGFEFVNPRRMNPRWQVMFFYQALIKRSQDAGLPREPSQTPYEYARTLNDQIPEASEPVDSMTESFMEARYTRHEIDIGQVGLVRRWWEQVRLLLRSRIDRVKRKRN